MLVNVHVMHSYGSLFPCLFAPFCGLFGIGALAFWIWMIVEVATKEPTEDKDRLMWLLIVVLVGWIGALIYFFARRPQRKKLYGR